MSSADQPLLPPACPTCGSNAHVTSCSDPWHITCTYCGALDDEPCKNPDSEDGCA